MTIKIVPVHDCSWNACLHQTYMLLLLLLLCPLLINHFLATFVRLFDEHSSTTILLIVLNLFASYAKHFNLAIFLLIVLNAQLRLFRATWSIEGSSILWRGLCYDVFVFFFFFLFLFCWIADTCTICVDYYWYWLIHAHRPCICSQTSILQYKYLLLRLCILAYSCWNLICCFTLNSTKGWLALSPSYTQMIITRLT